MFKYIKRKADEAVEAAIRKRLYSPEGREQLNVTIKACIEAHVKFSFSSQKINKLVVRALEESAHKSLMEIADNPEFVKEVISNINTQQLKLH